MNWPLQCDKESMRELTRTPIGPDVPDLVLEAIQGGVGLEVTCGGQVCRVADPESALALLVETFEWTPESKPSAKPEQRPPTERTD
jgi:hypothetical protein